MSRQNRRILAFSLIALMIVAFPLFERFILRHSWRATFRESILVFIAAAIGGFASYLFIPGERK